MSCVFSPYGDGDCECTDPMSMQRFQEVGCPGAHAMVADPIDIFVSGMAGPTSWVSTPGGGFRLPSDPVSMVASFPTIKRVKHGVLMSGVYVGSHELFMQLSNHEAGLLVDIQVGKYRDTFTVSGIQIRVADNPANSYVCLSDRTLVSEWGTTITFQ